MTSNLDSQNGAGDMPFVARVKRPTLLRDSVYEGLTEMIIAGSLQPGQHLVEVELARMLDVSRQPVREALQRLHTDGWVDLRPGFGAMVHVPTDDEVDQLLASRAALESESARLAAEHATDESVAKLRKLCKDGIRALEDGEIETVVRLNAELHAAITEMSHNKFLIDFAGQVARRVRWYYTPVAQARGVRSWDEHTQIVDAIADGDGDRAAQTMRQHTEHTRVAYRGSEAQAIDATAESVPSNA